MPNRRERQYSVGFVLSFAWGVPSTFDKMPSVEPCGILRHGMQRRDMSVSAHPARRATLRCRRTKVKRRYARAESIFIEAGGGNSPRRRLWKRELQRSDGLGSPSFKEFSILKQVLRWFFDASRALTRYRVQARPKSLARVLGLRRV